MIQGIWETRQVFIDGKELLPDASQRIYNHSPDGFSWGYEGSGPAQLALALLLYYMPKYGCPPSVYQSFKSDVIAGLPQSDFEIDERVVLDWIALKG